MLAPQLAAIGVIIRWIQRCFLDIVLLTEWLTYDLLTEGGLDPFPQIGLTFYEAFLPQDALFKVHGIGYDDEGKTCHQQCAQVSYFSLWITIWKFCQVKKDIVLPLGFIFAGKSSFLEFLYTRQIIWICQKWAYLVKTELAENQASRKGDDWDTVWTQFAAILLPHCRYKSQLTFFQSRHDFL